MATGTFRDDSHSAAALAAAIATQHTTDNGIYATPAVVDTKIATQHAADNASYAPLSAVSIHPFLLMG